MIKKKNKCYVRQFIQLQSQRIKSAGIIINALATVCQLGTCVLAEGAFTQVAAVEDPVERRLLVKEVEAEGLLRCTGPRSFTRPCGCSVGDAEVNIGLKTWIIFVYNISHIFALVHAILVCSQELPGSTLAVVKFSGVIKTTRSAGLGACGVIIKMNHKTTLSRRVTTSAVSSLYNYLDKSRVAECATVVDAGALRDVVRAVRVSGTA